MYKVDLLVTNAEIFSSYFKRFYKGYMAVKEGRVFHVGKGEDGLDQFRAAETIDCGGKKVIPGLIDIHMHIESSMAAPAQFCQYLVGCGVTTIVSEPHEIANVFGIEGIEAMGEADKGAPIDVYYGISSSVPSTGEDLETTGGVIGMSEMKQLLKNPKIACLGEVMNTRGILSDPKSKQRAFVDYLRVNEPALPLEGHCPRLKGLQLSEYMFSGIDADHTEHDFEEVRDRYFSGMFFEVQSKMLLPEVVEYIAENDLYEHTAFVTDDTMANVLVDKGHLNAVVSDAVKMGIPLEKAVYCATYTAARRMRLYDRGALAPGRIADFVVLQDESKIIPAQTWKSGKKVYDIAQPRRTDAPKGLFPSHFYESVKLNNITVGDFAIPAKGSEVTVRAMGVERTKTQTTEEKVKLPVSNGEVEWENSGTALVAVFERHGKNGGIGYGFATGDLHKRGAVASTYAHDHHNLLVAGHSKADMALAAETVRGQQGGICAVLNGKVIANLPLPVAGLLSEEPMEDTGAGLREVQNAMRDLGYNHYEPVMSLCTISLPVSPALKITDRGLIDVLNGEIVPLFYTQ